MLNFDEKLAAKYTNPSQKARVLTESWVLNQIYCPSCGGDVYKYDNNKPVADFYCRNCIEDFELKSKQGKVGLKVAAGAYSKMLERISSTAKPNFFFMGYLLELMGVNDFFVIPKHFFVPDIIEERKPLSKNARRASWIGSNILLSRIPEAGRIFYVKNGNLIDKKNVLEKWQKTAFLKNLKKPDAKGWILDIMNCIDSLEKVEFSLQEIYFFEDLLHAKHPKNLNIKAKIRQQLQFLRDRGYLEFLEAGRYRLR